jgi:hypothetical protein
MKAKSRKIGSLRCGTQDPARFGGALFFLAQNHEDQDSRVMLKSQVWTTESRSGRRARSAKVARGASACAPVFVVLIPHMATNPLHPAHLCAGMRANGWAAKFWVWRKGFGPRRHEGDEGREARRTRRGLLQSAFPVRASCFVLFALRVLRGPS